jgi:peptidyl-prolyl cis-trans isomerase D
MLQKIRDKITGWFASVFLGAIAVVFVFWGIRFESSTTTAAAKVNGESIPMEQVRRAWQERQSELQQAMRGEIPEAVMKAEQQKLLDDFIRRDVLLQHAGKMGYRVSDQEIVRQLESIPALQVDGKFSRDRYSALLRSQGRTEGDFEREFRRDLEITQLRNGIGVSAFATPGELRRRIELEGETRDVDYLILPAGKYLAEVSVKPEEVAAHYEQHKADYMTAESVSLQYLELKLADVAATIPVTDEALHEYYDQVAPERYVVPERRKARHILIETGKDDAAAKKKAEEIYARAKAGEDFAKLAEQYSDDPGSKAQGGELGWATRESYVKPFADALFEMKKGEISGPVKTQFGYHIIELEDVEPVHQRSYDEVKAELETDYRNDRAQSLFYEKSQQLADDSFAALTELDSVAKKLGMQLHTIDDFNRKGGGPLVDPKVIDAVFSDDVLQERQNSPAISIGDDDVVVLRVTDYRPATQRPLDEVRGEIEASLREQAARAAAEAAAKADAERLAAGTSLNEIAGGLGLKPAGAATFTRGQANVPEALLKAVFAAPRPEPGKSSSGTAVLPNGDAVVFLVSGVHAGAMPASADAAAQLAQQAQRAAGQAAGAEFAAYVEELMRTAKIRRNDKVFE